MTTNVATGEQNDLKTISMEELYDTAYPPRVPIVEGLIFNGIYLFVGSPKVGKSFFMAQLGYHVSMGIPLWGFPVTKGTVFKSRMDAGEQLEDILAGYPRLTEEEKEELREATKNRT